MWKPLSSGLLAGPKFLSAQGFSGNPGVTPSPLSRLAHSRRSECLCTAVSVFLYVTKCHNSNTNFESTIWVLVLIKQYGNISKVLLSFQIFSVSILWGWASANKININISIFAYFSAAEHYILTSFSSACKYMALLIHFSDRKVYRSDIPLFIQPVSHQHTK